MEFRVLIQAAQPVQAVQAVQPNQTVEVTGFRVLF